MKNKINSKSEIKPCGMQYFMKYDSPLRASDIPQDRTNYLDKDYSRINEDYSYLVNLLNNVGGKRKR